ncbi:MAG: hypothetical protein HXY49_08690 [Ignavibacteriaceae bacterium]|nr:hypothetical protein [Ignavibacteriaceae bacterium]
MKKTILISMLFISAYFFQACDVYDNYYADYDPPSPPGNVVVVNGNNRVDIYWDDNYERDLAGYNIYYSYSYDGKYTLIGSTTGNYFIDYEAANGTTYYYAVTAYDYNGNESDLSPDVAYATPRPEGFNQAIFDFRNFPNNSGYSFSDYSVVRYDDQRTDFFFENYNGTFYIDVWDDTDIQDMGSTNDIYDIPYAPVSGWSTTKDAIAKVGHTYVIWTWDNHFAKIRIKAITPDRMVFDWAYQLVEGNRELKPVKSQSERETLSISKLNSRIREKEISRF